jgi:hypothetical protein
MANRFGIYLMMTYGKWDNLLKIAQSSKKVSLLS